MKKNKKAEVYSFKALSSEVQSQGSLSESRKSSQHSQKQLSQIHPDIKSYQSSFQYPNKIKQGIFRHENFSHQPQQQPQLKYEVSFRKPELKDDNKINYGSQLQLHPKIESLNQEIQQNVKRRLQLQDELNRIKKIQQENQTSRQVLSYFDSGDKFQSSGIQKEFALRNRETDFVNQQVMRGILKSNTNSSSKGIETQKPQQRQNDSEREAQLYKNIQILTDQHMQTTLQKSFQRTTHAPKKDFYDLSSFMNINQQQSQTKPRSSKKTFKKQAQSYPTPPPITGIQQLLSRLTFPQIPKQNIQKLYKKCEQLYAIHESHSDLVYLMMLGCFHMGDHHGVRKYFKEILVFKKFQSKAYWVAAETEYVLENYERCVKLTEYCMQNLEDKFLPRFIYLKAKCYYEMGSFTNSIVCYNQLIRIKAKIPEYYLERAVLYDKLGYQKQCKQDYLMFGILKPEAKKYLQEKIMVQQNDGKRKQLLQIYKKMV